VLVLSSCGSDSTGDANRPSKEEFDAFLTDYCGTAIACCATLGRDPAMLHVENCKAQLAGKLPGFDRDAGSACLEQLRGASSGGTCWPVSVDPADPCNRVFGAHYGSIPAGGACTTDSDCSVPAGGSSMCAHVKRCQWQLPGKAGDAPCVAESALLPTLGPLVVYYGDGSIPQGYVCRSEDGVYCDGTKYPTGGCLPVKALGAECDGDLQCATGYCNLGVCSDLAAIGASCNGLECVHDGYCERSSIGSTPVSTCVARLPVGSACTNGEQCTTGNCNRDQCSPVTSGQGLVIGLMCL
jgi:hypothetical protein